MNFIKKINKYLLEHYPLIWNTRLVWMLGVSMLTHILFFLIGYFAVSNQQDIQSEYRLNEFYFDSPVVFFNILLSIIILLIWIIYYLQNNAFKNLYSLKKGTLFGQLCIILVIIFININQYYSFNKGLKLKIRNLYTWEEIDTDIKEFNKTAIFLIQNKNNYEINQKAYPKPFPLRHESGSSKDLGRLIDTTKANFYYQGNYYQFYNTDYELLAKDSEGTVAIATKYNPKSDLYNNSANDFKYRLVEDVSFYQEDVTPCLLNYSGTLYSYGQDTLTENNRLKYYENLFKRADENEIKSNLESFFNLAQKYQIEHNLNIAEWYALLDEHNYVYDTNLIEKTASNFIYETQKIEKVRKNYSITQFILTSKPDKWDAKKYFYTKNITVDNRLIDEKRRGLYDKYQKEPSKIITSKTYSKYKEVSLSNIPYCNFGNLDHFFKNTHSAYQPDKNKEFIYFYIIMTLCFGLLLFLFKVTDIKTLLLSFVAAAVVSIITGLIISYLSRDLKNFFGIREIESLIGAAIGLSIITASIVAFRLKWRKLITAILFSLSIFAIPVICLFLFIMYESSLDYSERSENILLKWMKEYSFWLVTIIWIVSISFYSIAIRKWKGLPE